MTKSKYKNIPLEVSIDSLNKKGNGVGTAKRGENAYRVEVPFTVPGDHVVAAVTHKRAGVCSGKLEQILSSSFEKVAPRCLHFGSCGGCRWQQIPYSKQLAIKRQRLVDLFQSLIAPDEIPEVVPCDPPWQYRNKMEFSFSQNKEGERFLGLILQGSKGRVLSLQECHLTNTWMVELLEVVRRWWEGSGLAAYHPHRDTGSLRTLTVREGIRTGDRMVILTVSGNPAYPTTKKHLETFTAALKERFSPERGQLSLFLKIHQALAGHPTQFYEVRLHGPEWIQEKMTIDDGEKRHELLFYVSPAAFFQPNTVQAEKLYSLALKKAQISADDLVYDLYCGTGTLSLCASKRAKEVIGIELSPEAVLDARENLKANGIDNVTFHQGDVGVVLKQLDRVPNVVFVDPPRAGLLPDAIGALLALQPPKIVYISCNPHTQKDDIEKLVAGGYCLKEIQPLDQCPHTVHLENIAVLIRHTDNP